MVLRTRPPRRRQMWWKWWRAVVRIWDVTAGLWTQVDCEQVGQHVGVETMNRTAEIWRQVRVEDRTTEQQVVTATPVHRQTDRHRHIHTETQTDRERDMSCLLGLYNWCSMCIVHLKSVTFPIAETEMGCQNVNVGHVTEATHLPDLIFAFLDSTPGGQIWSVYVEPFHKCSRGKQVRWRRRCWLRWRLGQLFGCFDQWHVMWQTSTLWCLLVHIVSPVYISLVQTDAHTDRQTHHIISLMTKTHITYTAARAGWTWHVDNGNKSTVSVVASISIVSISMWDWQRRRLGPTTATTTLGTMSRTTEYTHLHTSPTHTDRQHRVHPEITGAKIHFQCRGNSGWWTDCSFTGSD